MSNARSAAQSNANPMGFKNRIINGAMQINQRGAGSAVGPNGAVQHLNDRWFTYNNSSMTIGTSSDGTLSKVGLTHMYFGNNTGATKTTFATGDVNQGLCQTVEGYNFVDAMWGTANAKPVTISFRAKATQATTICVSLRNWDGSRTYLQTVAIAGGPQNYSITIPGCIDGVWKTDTSAAFQLAFSSLGGATYGTTSANAGKWLTANFLHTTDTTSNVMDTASRFVSIADVQLELGSVATPFDVRAYSAELAMCQRYYEALYITLTTALSQYTMWQYKVTKRVTPTFTVLSGTGQAGTTFDGGPGGVQSLRITNVPNTTIDCNVGCSAEF